MQRLNWAPASSVSGLQILCNNVNNSRRVKLRIDRMLVPALNAWPLKCHIAAGRIPTNRYWITKTQGAKEEARQRQKQDVVTRLTHCARSLFCWPVTEPSLHPFTMKSLCTDPMTCAVNAETPCSDPQTLNLVLWLHCPLWSCCILKSSLHCVAI